MAGHLYVALYFCWSIQVSLRTDIFVHCIADDALREAGIPRVPEGYPGTQDRSTYYRQAGDKAARVLGVKYKTLKESSVDTIKSIRERFPSEAP